MATARVLKRLGHDVEFRAEQTCCGQPSFNSGQWDVAREGAIRALSVFHGALARTGADYVVSSDPSCLLQSGGWLSREGKPILPLPIAEVLANDA